MARDYLAVQASSAPCEQVFSSGSEIVTTDRGSLNDELESFIILGVEVEL